MSERIVMDAETVSSTLSRLADEIVERARGFDGELALVGVRTRGVPLSRRLSRLLASKREKAPELGILDITLYRDDLGSAPEQPELRRTELPFDVTGAWIVLVDDVLFTGRTVRAAITELADYGRPLKIELLALVDRGSRELPIQADYVGASVETEPSQRVKVLLEEEDGRDEVLLLG